MGLVSMFVKTTLEIAFYKIVLSNFPADKLPSCFGNMYKLLGNKLSGKCILCTLDNK